MSSSADPLAARLAARTAGQVLALAAGIVIGTLAAVVLVSAVATATAPRSPLPDRLHLAAVGLPLVLGLYEPARRFVVRVPAAWLLAGRPGRTVLGWAIAGLAFPTVVLGGQLWLFGATLTNGIPPPDRLAAALVASLVAGLLAGCLEELTLRGALLRLLEARWGSTVAVALDPDVPVYLLDEPTAALDLGAVGTLHRVLRERRDAGPAVVLTSHAPLDAELADRLVFVRDGSVVADGAPAELLDSLPPVVRLRGAVHEAATVVERHLAAGHSYGTGTELRGFPRADGSIDALSAAAADLDLSVDRDEPTAVDLYEYLARVGRE